MTIITNYERQKQIKDQELSEKIGLSQLNINAAQITVTMTLFSFEEPGAHVLQFGIGGELKVGDLTVVLHECIPPHSGK